MDVVVTRHVMGGVRCRLGVTVVLSIALLGACGMHDGAETVPERIPNLHLHPLGTPSDGSDPRHGKTVVLNFWATWCGPCRKEMASLQRLADTLDPARFAVIGISVDEDRNLAREAVTRHGWRFAAYHDTQREARDALQIDTLPRSYIVAPDGHVLQVVNGALDWGSPDAVVLVGRLASAHPAQH